METLLLPQTKPELMARIEKTRLALEKLVTPLNDEQLTTPDAHTGWSIKDQLIHVAVWEYGLVALLQSQPRWPAMGLDETEIEAYDPDRFNEILVQRNKNRPLPEVMEAFFDSHQQTLSALARLSYADLLKPYRHYQPDDHNDYSQEPVLKWVALNTYDHYEEHLPLIEDVVQQTQP